MKLTRYKVTNFRSVKDSGWIEADDVTALIGVNESGKTNLLLPLWKLRPAHEGELVPTSDYPKKMFGDIRAQPQSYRFITAEFETGEFAKEVANMSGAPENELDVVHISRNFKGEYHVDFPNQKLVRHVSGDRVNGLLAELFEPPAAASRDDGIRAKLQPYQARWSFTSDQMVNEATLRAIVETLTGVVPENPTKTSALVPKLHAAIEGVEGLIEEVSLPKAAKADGVFQATLKAIPDFVYYSNYGNLDSEIYLPHVVENLKRTDLGPRESAKARTLRVLFRFVNLSPEEILELGRDFKDPSDPNREPSAEEIEKIAKKKLERSILLQSASAKLTSRFREWWKQGDYRFRFEADGNHFRIWVADDKRPEEVELESRSTGLQWFLSFYLVFLVESDGAHDNSVLLLDEPGLSLHPLAQKDLSLFFDGLADTNQIVYTTHSPFLVDADRLERARKVFVDDDGTTKSSADLRAGVDPKQKGASYAVHSALNLSVSESLLLGCTPVVVEGGSDQFYLTLIKSLLISAGELKPKREYVFPPAGGAKTAKVVAGILTGRDEALPMVLLDDDSVGRSTAADLKNGLYVDAKDRVLLVNAFTGMANSEIEDLMPPEIVARQLDRLFRGSDKYFVDVLGPGPIVPQIEKWAEDQGVTLHRGWKVDLARRVKTSVLEAATPDLTMLPVWKSLFETFD